MGNEELDELAADYPFWEFWTGVNDHCYARLPRQSPPVDFRGESPMDLRDQIEHYLSLGNPVEHSTDRLRAASGRPSGRPSAADG